MAAAEGWRDAKEAACARHKVALFGWTGCKPRDSMRLLEKMHNNIGSALKEKARRDESSRSRSGSPDLVRSLSVMS